MKAMIKLDAAERQKSGTGAARATRRDAQVPAVIYGQNSEARNISLPLKELTLAYKKGGIKSKLIGLNLGGKEVFALSREIQLHPVSDIIIHADFQEVTKDSAIRVFVPVHFKNQDRSIGLKRGGVLNVVRHEIEFFCSPDNIPSELVIDLLETDIGQSIHIESLELPKGAKPTIKRNFTVATITGRKEEKEEAKTEGAAAPAAAAADAPKADAKADDKGKK